MLIFSDFICHLGNKAEYNLYFCELKHAHGRIVYFGYIIAKTFRLNEDI